MSYQPPPPPPPGPPAGASGSSPGFDPKTVNALDWGILGAGFLAFLFSFIDFYDGGDVTVGGRTVTVSGQGFSAWHSIFGGGFFAWFAMLFAIAGAAAVAADLFAPQVSIGVPNRLAGLGSWSVALLFEIIAIFVTPGANESGFGEAVSVSLNHGAGFWISLIVIAAGLVLSLMRFQALGNALPGGLQGRVPNIGGYGPQGGMGGSPSSIPPAEGPRPSPAPYAPPPQAPPTQDDPPPPGTSTTV